MTGKRERAVPPAGGIARPELREGPPLRHCPVTAGQCLAPALVFSAPWGDTRAEAAQSNENTFCNTNTAPQAAKFNWGMELWLGMES